MDVVGHRPRPLRRLRGVRRRARRRAGPQRRRRVGPDRRGVDARTPGGGADGRVRVPRGLDRARLGRPAGGRDRARDPRGPAAAGRPGVGRYADAGGHAGVRADGADLPSGRGAPRGRAAVPRLPPPPDHRRGDGLVGLARPRDGRRARRAGRLPRAARLRGALRQAVPRGCADGREPLRPRHHRRRRRAGGRAGPARPGTRHPDGTARRRRPRAPAAGRAGARRRHLGRRDAVAAAGPARRTTAC